MMENIDVKKLQEKVYEISYSGFPLDSFFNDIQQNDNPKYNKQLAYRDLELIVDKFYELSKKEQTPTEEEIIKEWEDNNYFLYEKGNDYLTFINPIDDIQIDIYKDGTFSYEPKTYYSINRYISSKINKLITKTFKMFGWE